MALMVMEGHVRFHQAAVFAVLSMLLVIPGDIVVEGQVTIHVDVTLRNRMDPGEVVSMDCMLNDTSINPKGFLTGGASSGGSTSSVAISEEMTAEDAIFCDFKLGFVARDLVQVTVQCTADGGCSPMAVDFTNQGAYLNLSNGSPPSGMPDIPWSTLLPSQPHF